jgi:hypothetical protein
LRVILPGFTLERREDGRLCSSRRVLIFAALNGAAGRGDISRADAAVARRA